MSLLKKILAIVSCRWSLFHYVKRYVGAECRPSQAIDVSAQLLDESDPRV
eukprot:COSAG03_NODE_24657_length_271_cov_0.546512_1_plen_49_part_01